MVKISLAVLGLTAVFVTAAGRPDAAIDPNPEVRSAAPAVDANEFVVDAGHSSVVFRVIHLGAAPFWGRFNEVAGKFKIDAADTESSFVSIDIPVGSIDTNNGRRDGHLKSPDFFNAAEHPKITFKSSKVESMGEDRFRITGLLTVRGNAKEVVAEATHVGTRDAGERFGLRSGYEARFTIDRTEFDVNYGADSGALGKEVQIIIALEGMIDG